MAKNKALLCYVTASEDVLLERLTKETDDFVDSAELIYASKIYEILWRWVESTNEFQPVRGLPLYRINTTRNSTKAIIGTMQNLFKGFL